jgi:hypothetical protein
MSNLMRIRLISAAFYRCLSAEMYLNVGEMQYISSYYLVRRGYVQL